MAATTISKCTTKAWPCPGASWLIFHPGKYKALSCTCLEMEEKLKKKRLTFCGKHNFWISGSWQNNVTLQLDIEIGLTNRNPNWTMENHWHRPLSYWRPINIFFYSMKISLHCRRILGRQKLLVYVGPRHNPWPIGHLQVPKALTFKEA